jgi:hypothetical protein
VKHSFIWQLFKFLLEHKFISQHDSRASILVLKRTFLLKHHFVFSERSSFVRKFKFKTRSSTSFTMFCSACTQCWHTIYLFCQLHQLKW